MQPQMQQMMQPQNEVVYPSQIAMPQNTTLSQTGGDPPGFPFTIQPGGMFPRISAGGDGVIANPLLGQGNAMIVVDTGGGAMAQMGLEQGGGRRPRRYQSAAPRMGGDMEPTFSAMPSFSSGGSIQVTKLE